MYIYVTHGLPLTMAERPADIEKVWRSEIVIRSWEQEHLFDSTSRYRCVADDVPALTAWQRFLVGTFYNPRVPLRAEWRRVGDFAIEDLVAVVREGLEHDDDIIMQWFDGPEIIKLLESAGDWEEILLAVEAIGGGHEDTPAVADYVKRVLPYRE